MESEFLRIKCPKCGAVLTVKNMADIDSKSVLCPICKEKNLVSNFQRVVPKPVQTNTPHSKPVEEGETNYSKARPYNVGNEKTGYKDEEGGTDYKKTGFGCQRVGKLIQLSPHRTYMLVNGFNTIGRKAQSSGASVQIETSDMYMSRAHAEIEAYQSQQGTVFYFSNSKNKNATYINGQQVKDTDKIILNHGDTIKMGGTILRFEVE